MSGPIHEAVTRYAESRPDRGVWIGDRFRSWSTCLEQAEALADAWRASGGCAGHLVAMQVPSSWAAIVTLVAASRVGAHVMPIHTALGPLETAAILQRARPSLFLTATTDPRPTSGEDPDRAPLRCLVVDPDVGPDPGGFTPATGGRTLPGRTAPGVLLISSGTTARQPKICVHREANLMRNARETYAESGYRPADTFLAAGQFSHAFGLLSLHLALVAGGSVGLTPRWNAEDFLRAAAACGASVVLAAPAQVHDLISAADRPAVPALHALREIRTGGAPVPSDLVDAARATFGARVVLQWGMSELGVGCFSRGNDPDPDCGRPVGSTALRVVDAQHRDLPAGTVGNLEVRSTSLAGGYLGAGGDVVPLPRTGDGWFETGDVARVSSSGGYQIVGRVDDRINRGGLKFLATEVEAHLEDMPGMGLRAVLPVPDPRLGQRAALLASGTPGGVRLDLAGVTRHLTHKGVARYKHPEYLIIVDPMPLTAGGKVAKGQLVDHLRTLSAETEGVQ